MAENLKGCVLRGHFSQFHLNKHLYIASTYILYNDHYMDLGSALQRNAYRMFVVNFQNI